MRNQLLIVIVIVTITITTTAVATLPARERAALLDLYEATNPATWKRTDNWLNDDLPPCGDPNDEFNNNWIGVVCGASNQVEVLSLEWNGLYGTLPESLGNLTRLKVLNLGTNDLSGTLPAWLGRLTDLRVLRLSYNKLTGKWPQSMNALKRLELLELPYNDFIGNFNDLLTSHPRLRKLNVRGNRGFAGDLSSTGPAVKKMNQLRFLDAHWNNIGGDLPHELFQLPEIEEVILSGNDITGSLPRITRTDSRLRIINLQDNFIRGTFPASFSRLRNLTHLTLNKNYISGRLPRRGLHVSDELSLRDNLLSGGIPPRLVATAWASASTVDLSNNPLGGELPARIPPNGLVRLNLHSCQLQGTIPASLLSASPRLHALNLGNNRLTGTLPLSLGQATALHELWVQQNYLSGSVPACIGHLRQLHTLVAYRNRLEKLPESIGDCESLRTLVLSQNRFHQPLPEVLGYLFHLERLALHDNLFMGDSIPSSYGNLLMLKDFTVHQNLLTTRTHPAIDHSEGTPLNTFASCMDLSLHNMSLFKVCGTRNDFYVDSMMLDSERRWVETHGDNWQACYGKCKTNDGFTLHHNFQRGSRYQDMIVLANKAKFAVHMQYAHDVHKDRFDIHPPTFRFPFEYDAWKAEHHKNPSGYWLLKPSISCCGQNIRLIQGPDDPSMPEDLGNWIVQRFVHPPHIVMDRKYVLRLFALVTAFNPMKIYFYPDGDVFYTHARYSLNETKTERSRGYFITDYFFTEKQRHMFTSSSHLFQYLHEQGVDTDQMWLDVKDAVIKALIGVEEDMNRQENRHDQRRQTIYEVLGYDILFDEHLKPWVCEVNTTPNMGLEINKKDDPVVHEEDFDLKTKLMRDTLHVVGVHGSTARHACERFVDTALAQDPRVLRTEAHANMSAACWEPSAAAFLTPNTKQQQQQQRLCITDEDVIHLKDFECELQRVYATEFEVMFPAHDAAQYDSLFFSPRRYNQLLAWWYTTHHVVAPTRAQQDRTSLPWSRPVERPWRSPNIDWASHHISDNIKTIKWNMDEEGRFPEPEEDRWVLDDDDQFAPEAFAGEDEGVQEQQQQQQQQQKEEDTQTTAEYEAFKKQSKDEL